MVGVVRVVKILPSAYFVVSLSLEGPTTNFSPLAQSVKNDKKSGLWVGRVGGWGGLNITPGIPYSQILLVTLNDFPTKFYQNQAKIANVCHLSGFWVDG